jgi:probable phosphomutase (TIGR03848 family)
MPIFLLIRHGETDFNKKMHLPGRLPGIHLNKNGQRQVQLLADKLSSAPIKAIYSSPLERTLETAEPLARLLNLEVVPMPGLLETDCGEWRGQSVKKLRRQKIWQTVQRNPSLFKFPGGESIIDCQNRTVQAIESLRASHAASDLIACVSHADPIKQVIAFYLGLSLDNFQRLVVTPASVSALHIAENGSQLLMLNFNPSFSWDAFKPPKEKQGTPAARPA